MVWGGKWHWAGFGGWKLGEVFENMERWAVLMFTRLTPTLFLQGPPGGGGPPGTPIMPSPAGMSPLRPLSSRAIPALLVMTNFCGFWLSGK